MSIAGCDWEKWTALGTLAAAVTTFLAVLVALIPIGLAFFERKRSARALRVRLLPQLEHLYRIAQNRAAGSLLEVPDQDIVSLELALSQASLLTPKEQDALSKAVARLNTTVLLGQASDPTGWTSVAADLKHAYNEICKRIPGSPFPLLT